MATAAKPRRQEPFLSRHWRGTLAFAYIAVILFDFIIGPCVYFWVQSFEKEAVNDAYRIWQPLTLQGGGLFHMAMGAVLGVSSWGKTVERKADA
jgi:hypothetical protein